MFLDPAPRRCARGGGASHASGGPKRVIAKHLIGVADRGKARARAKLRPQLDDAPVRHAVEQGAGNVGQEYTALPEDVRRIVREETRRDVGDAGGPVEVVVEVRIGSGARGS